MLPRECFDASGSTPASRTYATRAYTPTSTGEEQRRSYNTP
jgi:hypothetical protein